MFDDDGLQYNFDHRHPWHRALARELSRAMRKPVFANMRRLERLWSEFARSTLDFIVDVVDTPSFWGGYEAWNIRRFGVALPITEGEPGIGLSDARLHYFVWKLVNVFLRDYSLPPKHPDVLTAVDMINRFAFGVGDDASAYWLDWLLRCWKGEFYRPRYPSVSVV